MPCSWASFALSSTSKPTVALVSPAHRSPSNRMIAITCSPDMSVSPNEPELILYASTPWHLLSVGACANSHGQAMLQLQTSNQSPSSVHVGTAVVVIVDL